MLDPLPENVESLDCSPDLSHLAFVLDESGMRERAFQERYTLKTLNLTTKEEKVLGPGRGPRWSPDGKWLLYTEPPRADPDTGLRKSQLCIVDEKGNNKRVLVQAADRGGTWSPDSRLVGYYSYAFRR